MTMEHEHGEGKRTRRVSVVMSEAEARTLEQTAVDRSVEAGRPVTLSSVIRELVAAARPTGRRVA